MSGFNPTTNRIPFGLLSEDEQKMLRNWPYGWEYYMLDAWQFNATPSWALWVTYRGKPKPPMVTSRWFNVLPLGTSSSAHISRYLADEAYGGAYRIAVLRIDTCNGVSTAHLEEI